MDQPSPSPPEREAELFEQALDKTGAEREALLEKLAQSDPALHARLKALLEAHEQPGGPLAGLPDPPESASGRPSEGSVGQTIGRYRLLEQIGEGGCGLVYVAEQSEPIRRRVALKVIKQGMDTRQVIARFEAERQALALMDHPNIARVLDAGTTETGRPYFVMELVGGVRITDYCDENRLTTEERLDLFVQICHAIQHAHQKGIIHRDIKPSNILVTVNDGVPIPKVIDFGIAKAIGQQLTDKTVYTAFAQFIGTPAYMSPEQAVMTSVDIDTRSDIYSLGVLLYELLTGHTPFDPKELTAAGLDGMRRVIRETEPVRPSTRLRTLANPEQTTVAQARHTEPSQLVHLVRGDLDWIVMKCLEKDRARRYETASGLAEDVMRHLRDEVVAARPPSKLHRLRKSIRRHRLAYAAATAVITALALGGAFSAWQAVRAWAAEKKALAEAKKSEALMSFLLEDLLMAQSPERNPVKSNITLLAALDQAAGNVDKRFTNQPVLAVAAHAALGEVYLNLDLRTQAETHLQKALVLNRRVLGPEHHDTLAIQDRIATLRQAQGRIAEAERLFRTNLATRLRLLGPNHEDTLTSANNLFVLLVESGKVPEGESLARHYLPSVVRRYGKEAPATLDLEMGRAQALVMMGKRDEALVIIERVYGSVQRVYGPENPRALTAANIYATLLQRRERFEEAEKRFREIVEARRRVQGDAHWNTLVAIHNLAVCLSDARKYEEALGWCNQCLDGFRGQFGMDDPRTLGELGIKCDLLVKMDRGREAEPLLTDLLERRRRQEGISTQALSDTILRLGEVLTDNEKAAQALPLLTEALDIRKGAAPTVPRRIAEAQSALGACLTAQARYQEAEPLLLEAYKIVEETGGTSTNQQKKACARIISLYEHWGRPEDAARWRSRTLSTEPH